MRTKAKSRIDRNPTSANNSLWRVSALARELGGSIYLRDVTLWFDAGSGLHDVQLSYDSREDGGVTTKLGAWDSDANIEGVAIFKLRKIREARARAGSARQRAHAVLDMMAEPEQHGRMTANRGFHYRVSDTLDCAVAFVEWMAPKELAVRLVGGPEWKCDISGQMTFADAIERLRGMIDEDCGAAS